MTEINAIDCTNFIRLRINRAAKNEVCTLVCVSVIITRSTKLSRPFWNNYFSSFTKKHGKTSLFGDIPKQGTANLPITICRYNKEDILSL